MEDSQHVEKMIQETDAVLNWVSTFSTKGQEKERETKGKGRGRKRRAKEGRGTEGEAWGGVTDAVFIRRVLFDVSQVMKEAKDIQTMVQWFPRIGRFLSVLSSLSWVCCRESQCCEMIFSLLLDIFSRPYLEEGEQGSGEEDFDKNALQQTKAKLREWVAQETISLFRMQFSPWPLLPSSPSPSSQSALSPCFPLSFSPSPSLSSSSPFLPPPSSPSQTLSLLSSLKELGSTDTVNVCLKEYRTALSQFREPVSSGISRGMLLKSTGCDPPLLDSLPSFHLKNSEGKYLSNPYVFYQRSTTSLLRLITDFLLNHLSCPLLLAPSRSPPFPFSTPLEKQIWQELHTISDSIQGDPSLFSVMVSLLFSEIYYSNMDLYFVCCFLTAVTELIGGGGDEVVRRGGDGVPSSSLSYSSSPSSSPSSSSPSSSPCPPHPPSLTPSIISFHFQPPAHPHITQILTSPPSPHFYLTLNSLRLSLPSSSLPSLLLLHASHSSWSRAPGIMQAFLSPNRTTQSAVFQHIVWFWFPFFENSVQNQWVDWLNSCCDTLHPLFQRSDVSKVTVGSFAESGLIFGGDGVGGMDEEEVADFLGLFDNDGFKPASFEWDAIDHFQTFLKSDQWVGVGGVGGGRVKVLLLLGLLLVTPLPHIWISEVLKYCLEEVEREGRKQREEGGKGDSEIVLFGFIFDFFDFLTLKLDKEGRKRQSSNNNPPSFFPPLHPSVFSLSPPSSSFSSHFLLPSSPHLFSNAFQQCFKQWVSLGCQRHPDPLVHRAYHFFHHLNFIFLNYGEKKEEKKRKTLGGRDAPPLKKTKKHQL